MTGRACYLLKFSIGDQIVANLYWISTIILILIVSLS